MNNNLDWNKPVTLADIVDALEAFKEVPQPFNGATRLFLSRDVASELAGVLQPFIENPLIPGPIMVEINDLLPAGYGCGWRPWRKGDDPALHAIGAVMVWFLGPAAPKPSSAE